MFVRSRKENKNSTASIGSIRVSSFFNNDFVKCRSVSASNPALESILSSPSSTCSTSNFIDDMLFSVGMSARGRCYIVHIVPAEQYAALDRSGA